jgi:hypothetical protein
MTPKEKANELYDLFFDTEIVDITKAHKKAKKYALIAVDSHLSSIEVQTGDTTKIIEVDYIQKMYWQEVKNEIEKI